MDFLAEARRRAFSYWLRTGRLPRWARPATPEFKFNPWHDPDDGRFTFAGTGRYFGPGRADGAVARMHERPPRGGRRNEPFGGFGGGGQGFNGGGAGGSWDAPQRKPQRTPETEPQSPGTPSEGPKTSPPKTVRPRAARSVNNPRYWRVVRANGYTYQIDAWGRTRRVYGDLVENPAQQRSRSAQRRAGRPDRRTSDEGGHFIARRFNGPTETFNHFAQDANFNRSGYRALENQWADSIRRGKHVYVSIEPVYEGSSRRPSAIVVSYWTSGVRRTVTFPNEPQESSSAKR